MPLPEIKAALAKAGFTGIRAYDCVIPLNDWDPYGLTTVNVHQSPRPYLGTIVEREGEIYVRDAEAPGISYVLGLWKPEP
jgi:hypothetical protein